MAQCVPTSLCAFPELLPVLQVICRGVLKQAVCRCMLRRGSAPQSFAVCCLPALCQEELSEAIKNAASVEDMRCVALCLS